MTTPDVRIDRELCIGSENCLRYAPATFETDGEGKATLKPEPRDPDDVIAVAVSACPVGALSLASRSDRETG